MFRSLKLAAAGLLATSGVLLAGCQSSGTKADAATGPITQAVACEKCRVTWVNVPNRNSKTNMMQAFTTRKSHECPDCRDAVANFFATGKPQHTCKTCGDSMDHCEVH
jgi:hypothetical protein